MSTYQLILDDRRRLGMTQKQFANALQVSRGAVQQWEMKEGTVPKRANQPRVAGLLGISVAELVLGRLDPERAATSDVPLVLETSEQSSLVVVNFNLNANLPRVPVTVPVKRYTYALRVHGDSMVGEQGDSFPDGSIVIVEPELEAHDGDYVIAVKPGQKITFRKLVRDGGDLYLKPLNSRYPIEMLGTASVVGIVREFSKRFR